MTAQQEIDAGDRFAFGSNWARFLGRLDEAGIKAAEDSLLAALQRSDLDGVSFLDAGCGSGLFSLAARRLGASVVSFDFDPSSVACAAELRRRYADDERWQVLEGSVLDEGFVRSLGAFEVVYSWGVLHHTSDMWRAFAIIDEAVAAGGRLFISIYNDQGLASAGWKRVKRRYNASGPAVRGAMLAVASAYFGSRSAVGRRLVRSQPQQRVRGMDAGIDLVDWIGGYPFEVARPEEVFAFYRDRGYELEQLRTCAGRHGCNEYVLRKRSDDRV